MKKTFILTLSLLVFTVLNLFAQIEINRNITVDDGLAYSQVISAFEDSKGILWFGTTSGISEWNSIEIKNYYKTDGLPSHYISAIVEDKQNLIFGTNKGLVFYNRKIFFIPKSLPVELKSKINKIYKTTQNKFLILTEQNGLWIYDGKYFYKIKNSDSIKANFISSENLADGKILIGTSNKGVFSLSDNRIEQYPLELISNHSVTDILQDSKGNIFFAVQGFGVVIKKYDGKIISLTKNEGLPSNYVNDVEEGFDKEIYIATRDGVTVINDLEITKTLDKNSGLSNEFITKIIKSKSNFLLLLSEGGGIYLYRPNVFLTYNQANGLINNSVWIIHETKDSAMIFTTDEGVTRLKNNKFSHLTTKDGLSDDMVISIIQASDGTLYFGTHNNGVTIVYPDGRKKIINKKNGLPDQSVWFIIEGDDGLIYFITHKGGVAVFSDDKISLVYNQRNGMPESNIIAAYKKQDGTVLLSFENHGIFKLTGGKFNPYRDDMYDCSIWSIFESKDNILYFGTSEYGIIKCYSETKRDTIGIPEGLSNNTVIGFEEDEQGNIYAITDNGLNIIKYNSNGIYYIRQVLKISGLAHNECNQGAIYKDSNGNVWVGTIGGVTKINPKLFSANSSLSNVVISSIRVLDFEVSPSSNSESTFEYNQNFIRFEFTGINYLEPTLTKYKYRLVGLDDNWFETKDHFSQYANLSGGSYVFEVKAANEWGEWSEPTRYEFTITKPFWLTWWFFTVNAIIIILIIFAIIYLRVYHLLKIERLRSSISADLHDEIGSGLSEISMLSELLKYNNEDEKVKSSLAEIGEKTRGIIERLSDIIWIVNPHKETLKDLILRIQDSYHELLSHSDINLTVSKLDLLESITLPLDVRQHLFLITKEAVNNAIKYSNCSNIKIDILKRSDKLILQICDNGQGISETEKNNGNGLYNMRKRAELIKAEFEIDSEKEKGTKVKVAVPFNKITMEKR